MLERGVFTFWHVVYLVGLSLALGYLAALSMWNVWLKKRM
jgi:hypothetical protein